MIKGALVLAMLLAVGLTADFCWKNSYGRGVGKPITTCSGNLEQNGALCYDRCKTNFYGVGPVCWESCKPGYTDDGALCRKDVHIYGKGCCCTVFGCCHNCKEEYTDDGCTCRKDAHIYAKGSYGRGAGYPLGCAAGLELNGALCYDKCKAGHNGVGPVCWGGCPAGWADCGAGCAPSAQMCGDKIINMVTDTGFAIANTVSMVVGASAATKAAQKAVEIAKMVKTAAPIANKVAKYANQILTSAKTKGISMSADDAQKVAEETIGQFAGGLDTGSGDNWDMIMDKVAQVDPTGIMAAAKTFKNPLCNSI